MQAADHDSILKQFEEERRMNSQLLVQIRQLEEDAQKERRMRMTFENEARETRSENTMLHRSREDLATQLKVARDTLEDAEEEQMKLQDDVINLQRRIAQSNQLNEKSEAERSEYDQRVLKELDEERKMNSELKQQMHELQEQLQRASHPSSSGRPNEFNEEAKHVIKQHQDNNQILLEEIEEQELEIERLFKQNNRILEQFREIEESNQSWQEQCKDVLEQNERLQDMLQESATWKVGQSSSVESTDESEKELMLLKDQVLHFERLYREEQALNVKLDNALRLSEMRKQEVIDSKSDLQQIFIPVLATIEDKLLKLQSQKLRAGSPLSNKSAMLLAQ